VLPSCVLQEKELKDALTNYNDKNAQKTELVGKLFEIVTEKRKAAPEEAGGAQHSSQGHGVQRTVTQYSLRL